MVGSAGTSATLGPRMDELVRLYVIPLRMGNMQRRLFFEGPDTHEASVVFDSIARMLGAAEEPETVSALANEAVRRFSDAGFVFIAH